MFFLHKMYKAYYPKITSLSYYRTCSCTFINHSDDQITNTFTLKGLKNFSHLFMVIIAVTLLGCGHYSVLKRSYTSESYLMMYSRLTALF